MMIRSMCLLLLAGLAAARPSAKAEASPSSIMYRYVVPGSYYPYYNFGLRSLDGEPITNVLTPEEVKAVEDIKTPEIAEPILHLGGVPVAPVETKVVEEPTVETVDTKVVEEPDTEVKDTETTVEEETTSEILPVKESEKDDVTETVEFAEIPEGGLIIAEEITKAPVVEKDEKKDLTGVIPSLGVLVKPLSQYSQYLPSLSQYSQYLPSFAWLPNVSSWWPFRYGDVSRFSNRVYSI